jgi:hypothetical protein
MIAASPKIEALMLAMAEHEGWHPIGKNGFASGSRSYRNHNPGNLRASPFACGNDGGYAVFRSDMVGFMALHWDLMQKAKGNTSTGLGPKSTLRDLIHVWAPPSDGNNSDAYVQSVSKKSGISADATLEEIFTL